MGITNCDASNMVRLINEDFMFSLLIPVVSEIRELFHLASGGSCKDANKVAHSFATSSSLHVRNRV